MKNSIIRISNDPQKESLVDKLRRVLKERYKKSGVLLSICIILGVWQIIALFNPPIILPSPKLTMQALIDIIRSDRFYVEVLVTFQRFLIGISGSIIGGTILGILLGSNKVFKIIVEPLIYFIQATPPILYMTIAMIWFGLDGRATIFIVFLASIPIMAINIEEGFENIDIKLMEMGKIFQFTKMQMIKEIVMPPIKPYFMAGVNVVIGYGWKLVIMGEVLSSNSGLGSQITDARMNLQMDKVFALGLIVILFCFFSQKIISILVDKKRV